MILENQKKRVQNRELYQSAGVFNAVSKSETLFHFPKTGAQSTRLKQASI